MIVFYTISLNEDRSPHYSHDFITPWMANCILPCDISYWLVPGTADDD